MSTFLITKFKSRQSNVMYVKHATQNDLFINSNNPQDTKRVMDFMCSPTYVIHAVKRVADNVEFEVGTKINSNVAAITNRTIYTIKIENGEIKLGGLNAIEIALQNAVIYTPPTPTPIPHTYAAANNAQTTNLNQTQKDAFFNTIQNTIIAANPRALRLPDLMKNRKTETLTQFLTKFFTQWNNTEQDDVNHRDTIFADNGEVQTEAGKRRSVGDIFMICRYYYPNVTLKQVYDVLLNQLPTTITTGFRTSKCSTINKRVWYYDSEQENGQFDLNTNDEYGNRISVLKENLQ